MTMHNDSLQRSRAAWAALNMGVGGMCVVIHNQLYELEKRWWSVSGKDQTHIVDFKILDLFFHKKTEVS